MMIRRLAFRKASSRRRVAREDLRVREKRDDRAGAFCRADDLEVRCFLSPLEPHPVLLSVPLHADLEPLAQPIDHRQADAVQPAGHLVHLPLELAAAVHPRQDQFDSGNPVLRMDVDRDAPSIVRHRHGSVRVEGNLDFLAEPCHRLVNRVVDNLVDEVVEAPRIGRSDVHRRPFSDRL